MTHAITIGSKSSSDIRINEPSVSGHHAVVHLQDDAYRIEDAGSTNGVTINGWQVQEAGFSRGDVIRLGDYSIRAEKLIEQIQHFINSSKSDYTSEFESLYQLFLEYRRKKIGITRPSRGPIFIRLIITAVVIVVILRTIIIPREYQFALFAVMSAGAVLPSLFGRSATERTEQLDQLKLGYIDRLICPKCRASMIEKTLPYWETMTTCPNNNCDVMFRK